MRQSKNPIVELSYILVALCLPLCAAAQNITDEQLAVKTITGATVTGVLVGKNQSSASLETPFGEIVLPKEAISSESWGVIQNKSISGRSGTKITPTSTVRNLTARNEANQSEAAAQESPINEVPEKNAKEAPEKPAPNESPKEKEVKIRAEDLQASFEKDPAAAKKTYAGKELSVSGKITGIKKGKNSITIQMGNISTTITNPSERVKALRIGDRGSLKGALNPVGNGKNQTIVLSSPKTNTETQRKEKAPER